MSIKQAGSKDSLSFTSFARTSWVQPSGAVPAFIHEARVFNVNMVNWTVDVATVFDQKVMLDIQVGSPYMHPYSGEGSYMVPEVGAKCYVCIPSDGPPPFVLAFIMPAATIADTRTEDAPMGTSGTGSPSDFTYAGGRARGKPGDIVSRGRDGNFMILHRGGVAQFGSTALAQRICVPLNNLVTDISQNYNHFNSGGAINWGVQDRGTKHPDTEYRHTFRVFADDEYADLRFSVGKVRSPVLEPVGDAGENSRNTQMGIGSADTVFEFVLAPNGFDTDAGNFKATSESVKLRIFFDRAGNAMARFEGSVNLRVKKDVKITVDETMAILVKKAASLVSEQVLQLTGSKGVNIDTAGGVVTINGGGMPVAHVGSEVEIVITVPIEIMTSQGAGTIISGQTLSGYVVRGNSTVLV